MRKFLISFSAVIISVSLWAQAPQKMSYQAVFRGANNTLLIEKLVSIKISVLQGSENGLPIYSEIHTPTTNANGLASLIIGSGKNTDGDFTKIDWSKGPYFLKTETDISGGIKYDLITTSELLSVPYALYAGNALPSGGSDGQVLTICDGIPTWSTGGICPGKITTLDCINATNNGNLKVMTESNGVSSVIEYTGGNNGIYDAQNFNSKGVTGLKASIVSGNFAKGKGSLIFEITGTPSTNGIATFEINIGGTSCILSRIVQNPTSGYGPNISDIDGNTYKTIYIGTQQWMAENLKVTKYSDGTTIPNITDNIQWTKLTSGAWCYHTNDINNNDKYGKLYNWYAVSTNINGNKNVCPSGWHVPTDAEWTVLTDYLGGKTVAGSKMKEIGNTNWKIPNTDATNTSLFTGLPAGKRDYDNGGFYPLGLNSFWWSNSESYINQSYARQLSSSGGTCYIEHIYQKSGLSIRCLKD
jgi:uncharacterized protein (TIGR02145 family)